MQINLISDTVTVPSKGMLQCMMEAEVGDDVFKQDPSVIFLEQKIASMFGKEKGMFFPSGIMSNQVAIGIQTNPGDQLICDTHTHIYHYEAGGAAANWGISCHLIHGNQGRLKASQIEYKINNKSFYHTPQTKLVCLENTCNRAGGTIYKFEDLMEIHALCQQYDLRLHLDGARIWNALVETNQEPKDYGHLFDTISVCFSKGLGAPIGSMLLFDEKDHHKALRLRTRLGGNMRQSGYLAACADYALNNHFQSLKNDHQKAKEIAHLLASCSFIHQVEVPQTNIIMFSLNEKMDETQFVDWLAKKNIYILSLGKGRLRIVTHRDYVDHQHQRFLSILRSFNTKGFF
ncbi:MAG: aminotransferase class I/II-fold pyridoxal phosphate-dependent enzyme [Flavobacteriaceae bacterium]|nr:aminotransferase class I/II-fold pyridoxal phosphate-dependent enzyme [Flavobacteriaceae bacterium]MCY4266694.1 aminotransferase class I/II-fold pyridoxal phosphate-dependent enzyme [Flavobacteriaceae bacterium]